MSLELSATGNPTAVDTSVRLLLELHDLIVQGRGDEADADAVREQMEMPWHSMTEAEQVLVNGLSADLYTIGEAPRGGETLSLPTNALERLVNDGNWPAVLQLTRSKHESLSSDEATFTRAVAWMHLGQPEVALRFFRELGRLRAYSDAERIWLLTCLMQTDRPDETLEFATQFAESNNPLVRLRVSNSMSLAAQHFPGKKADEIRKRAIEIVQEALPRVEPFIGKDSTAKILWQSSLFQLALDYEEDGENQKAVAACKRILERDPSNLDALILLDWLTYDEDPHGARRRFRGHFRQRLPQTTGQLPSLVTDSAA